jgi:hypothetical protein
MHAVSRIYKKRLRRSAADVSKNRFRVRYFFAGLILLLVLVAVFLFIHDDFARRGKAVVAINSPGQGITVAVFDFDTGEITSVVIPGNTQLTASRGLGTWKAGSLWQLGVNEHLGGQLLAETIAKNFHFPVTYWADSSGLGFTLRGLKDLIGSGLGNYKTNLSSMARIKLVAFALGVGEGERTVINLADTSYLTRGELTDGEDGYYVSSSVPENLIAVFSEGSQQVFRMVIKDATNVTSLSGNVGSTIEMLGVKIVAVDKGNTTLVAKGRDCEVIGQDNYFVTKIARLFSCEVKLGAPEGNFDLELILTSDFARRF